MENHTEIYLDSAATASNPKYHVIDNFANPNSTHDAGRKAFAVLESARESIANNVGAKRPSEIIFTSGATESNNMAIIGIAKAQVKNRNFTKKPKVCISAIEHESVMSPAMHLKNEGFDVELLDVDFEGLVDIENAKKKIDEDTVLVSVQLANTEIGTIQDLKPVIELAYNKGALFHSDCVGALGRIPINVSDINLDAASFAGHKIGTAKGIGVLYLKAKTACEPILFGSGQEKGLRGGTQNVSLAKSFQIALDDNLKYMEANNARYYCYKKHIITELKGIDNLQFTLGEFNMSKNCLSNILHLLFKDKSSETLVLEYGKRGIIVSGGPACSSEDKEPSHVLKSIKVDKDYIDGAIRISFLEGTSHDDIDRFILATKEIVKEG